MPTNPDLHFDEPQPLYRAYGRLEDEAGNQFLITVTGPEDACREYIMAAPIHLEIRPPEAPAETEQENAPTLKQEESYKEPAPDDPTRALDIEIVVAKPSLDRPCVLYLRVDPDIAQGYSHYYYVYSASSVWADCVTSVGDADLYLQEQVNGNWVTRASSLAPATQPDSVRVQQQTAANWRVRVHGYDTSTYSLSGSVNVL